MEMGRNLEHTTERHQRGFKVPMEMGSLLCRAGMYSTQIFRADSTLTHVTIQVFQI